MEDSQSTPLTFNTPIELAQYVDKHCQHWNGMYDRDFSSILRVATGPDEVKSLLQAESVALEAWFSATTMRRLFEVTQPDGQVGGSLLPQDLPEAPFDYYVQRLQQTDNLFLKARYALALWNAPAPYKRHDYLKTALDSLLLALAQADCTGSKVGRRDCYDIIRQICALAAELKYKHQTDAVQAAVLDRYTGSIPMEAHSHLVLLGLINEHGKLFRANTPEILAATRIQFDGDLAKGDAYTGLMLAELAVKTAQASGGDVREWHHRQGLANEQQAEARLSDDSSLISMKFYTDAARAYQLAGNDAAAQAALQKAQSLKGKLRLGLVSTEADDEQNRLINEDIKQQTALLLTLEPADVFSWLGSAPDAIPDFEAIKQSAAEAPHSFMDFVSVLNLDINKNFQTQKKEGEIPVSKLQMPYKVALTLRLHYLASLVVEGTKAGKLTFNTFQEFIQQRSWISQSIRAHDYEGKEFTYSWEPLILPAAGEFFRYLEHALAGKSQVSLVLCLDSLVPKVEALMRELLQLTGNATVATGSKAGMQEVFFDELLNALEKTALFTGSDAQFFRYIFTSFGQNVRNNIAHGYYKQADRYSFGSAILVFCALLRLVSFRLSDVVPTATEGEI
ncbi:DUF4209 domain-containing protein [Hymenobacter algoricola]|uniref:DUF4209 domain-containing protein n=1 Tax=Hymenobacter algoricola TaxID=486267 RepID=A0ABP7MYG3_9BACT